MGEEFKRCPKCGEILLEDDDGIELCFDCGYFNDPKPEEILQQIQNICTEVLLEDIPIDLITEYGFEGINKLRRQAVQMECCFQLGIGKYSPNICEEGIVK